MKFGEYLREQRTKKNWTQPDAAEQCGIEQSYLSKLENGKAIPSEEVFEKLRKAYGFIPEDVCTTVSDPELQKMREVAAIRTALTRRLQKGLHVHRRGLILGALLIVLGSGLLAHWYLVGNSTVLYEFVYESKGLVHEGESPYVFKTLPGSSEMAHMSGQSFERSFLEPAEGDSAEHQIYRQRQELLKRLDYQQQVFSNDRGDLYIQPVDNGSRTFMKVDQRPKQMTPDTAIYFIFGIICVVGGLLSQIVVARWR